MQRISWSDRVDLLTVFLLLFTLGCAGCAGMGSSGSEDQIPIDPSPSATPAPPADTPAQQQSGNVGSDIGETVSDALDNAVDTVKGRDEVMVRRGLFFSVGLRNLERSDDADSADVRIGNETDITNVSVGYDQSLNDGWVAGIALDFARRESSSSSGPGSSTSSDTGSVYVFSSYDPNPFWSFSAYAGYGSSSVSSNRTAQSGTISFVDDITSATVELPARVGDVTGNSHSDLLSVGLSVKRNVYREGPNQVFVGADLDYSNVTTDAYDEQGSTNTELAYREHSRENLLVTLSASANRVFNSSHGVFVPAITLSYVNQEPDENSIIADLVADTNQTTGFDPRAVDRGFGELDLDVVWVRPGGWQYFANLNANFENDFEESRGAKLGARREF